MLPGKHPRDVLGTAALDTHSAGREFGARQVHHTRRHVYPCVAAPGIALGEPGEVGARAAPQIQHRAGGMWLHRAAERLPHAHQYVVRRVALLCQLGEGIVVRAGLPEIGLVGAQAGHAPIILS